MVRAASRRLISGMVSGIMPGSGGGGWSGLTGGGAWVSVRSFTSAAVTAQIARAAMTSTAWRSDRGVQPGLALVEAEAVLAEFEIFFYWPSQPGGADQPGLGEDLPFGHEAVVEGQLAGRQVAADEQVVARRCGGEPGPGVPPLALGAAPGGADFPAPRVLQQRQ